MSRQLPNSLPLIYATTVFVRHGQWTARQPSLNLMRCCQTSSFWTGCCLVRVAWCWPNAGARTPVPSKPPPSACGPGAPKCGTGPVSAECKARALGDPTTFPQFSAVKKWLDVEDVSVAVRNAAGEVLLVQRSPELSLWGGLWELPRATRQDGEALESCAARAACWSTCLVTTR